jgi:alkaline phosphatase D
MKTFKNLIFFFLPFIMVFCEQSEPTYGPYFGTGIKIGEVTTSSVIIWSRLTQDSVRVGPEAPVVEVFYPDPNTGELKPRQGRPDIKPVVKYPEGYDVNSIEGATPGAPGQVRIKYKLSNIDQWTNSPWRQVDPEADFTSQFLIEGLLPGSKYDILVQAAPSNQQSVSAEISGSFTTAPDPDVPANVNFIVTTGTSYPDIDSENGYRFYQGALKLAPDFFVHTGDILYYDGYGKSVELARWHWDRMYSLPNHIDFHRQVPAYFIKDDHDTWMNDCYPGMETKFMGDFTYEEGTRIFLEEVPMSEKTYRTVRWGKDLQIWLVEGRDYRSPNPMPDGPEKTIWGKEQMDWFKKTVAQSDATFKVLLSPTPVVGPDRERKNDNHANEGFSYEGSLLREFLSENNMVVVCGDRHWQYISRDLETGLLEFSCGPGGNDHAGGWPKDRRLPEHLYLNVVGGFMEGSVEARNGNVVLIFRHYSPEGKRLNEYEIEAEYFE